MERFDDFDAVGDGEPVAQGARSGAAAPASVPSPTPTPVGRSASASPSPTPTFAATDRPSRRARRLRWKPGVTRPMMALSALSFTLMVAGVAGYVSAIPAMLYQDDDAAVVPLGAFMWVDGQMQQAAAVQQAAATLGPVAAQPAGAATASDAASALGIGASASPLGASSLATGAANPAVASSFARVEQAAAANGQASGSAGSSASGASGSSSASGGSTSGNSGSGSGSSAGGGSDAGSAGASEPSQPSGPTEAEEAAAYEVLLTHLSRVNGYVARLNNAIVAFNNDALTASLEQRYADYNECAAIDSQTLTDFLTLRNYDLPSGSRWAEQKSNLQRAYIALDRYLTVYYDAWDRNVYYADPSTAYDYWMETIWADQDANGNSVLAAQLNDVLASISL